MPITDNSSLNSSNVNMQSAVSFSAYGSKLKIGLDSRDTLFRKSVFGS